MMIIIIRLDKGERGFVTFCTRERDTLTHWTTAKGKEREKTHCHSLSQRPKRRWEGSIYITHYTSVCLSLPSLSRSFLSASSYKQKRIRNTYIGVQWNEERWKKNSGGERKNRGKEIPCERRGKTDEGICSPGEWKNHTERAAIIHTFSSKGKRGKRKKWHRRGQRNTDILSHRYKQTPSTDLRHPRGEREVSR